MHILISFCQSYQNNSLLSSKKVALFPLKEKRSIARDLNFCSINATRSSTRLRDC